jgi:hypothetical protein
MVTLERRNLSTDTTEVLQYLSQEVHVKSTTLVKTIGTGLMVYGLVLVHPFSAVAQESPPAQQEKPAGKMGMQGGMMGQGHRMMGMMPEMQQMHEQMEKMHQETQQELQQQLTALREHTKAMEGVSDTKELLTEMKKHQQMTDALLGTMIEQREKMHARMQAHHEQMRSRMSKKQEPEEHETHHEKE